MSDLISKISKQTLLNLTKNNKEITPNEYSKEYCKVANELNLSQQECNHFKELLAKISKEELTESNIQNIESINDIIEVLLLRSPKKNINKMSELMQSSLQPSISLSINDDLHSFCIKIGDSPSLIFEESIQQEMEKFIEKRFEVDKKIVAQKTADIARLISLMNKYLSDAIDSSKSGSSNVSEIKDELQSIKISGSTKDELNQLQTKLVQAAITIENEMTSVSKNLENGKTEVVILENKVKTLERELADAKLRSTKDFLTGTLNRKTYEEEIKKFENEFIRKGQNYAIIFFDIDHFKNVNDTYGHECGDIVLKTFASLLLKLTRDLDIVGRYGGEEFVVALHYNNKPELDKYVSRIKSVITKNKFIYKEHKLKITFSAGVQIRTENNSISETVTNADKLLYKAKQTGRNKVIFWDKKEI